MVFSSPLVKGKLLKRYKRFLADVQLENGEKVTAHCPNTGAMTGCDTPGFTVYLRHDPNPKRKLAYTWEIAVTDDGAWIGINTHNANKLVEEVLQQPNSIVDTPYAEVKREVHYQQSQSRFDFALLNENREICHLIEVKSVTLANGNQGYFPDTKTQRGTKHCLELAKIAHSGLPCTLVFCAQHSAIKQIQPAWQIDEEYAHALLEANRAGVKIVACGCALTEEKLVINQILPVYLQKTD